MKLFFLKFTSAIAIVPLVFLAAIPYAQAFKVKSYLPEDLTTIEGLLTVVLQVVITISVPIIVLFIIYSGFLYVTARGNAEQTQTATRTLVYAIVGGILILGAVAFSVIIENLVGEFTT